VESCSAHLAPNLKAYLEVIRRGAADATVALAALEAEIAAILGSAAS
jgi:hypothetical protein